MTHCLHPFPTKKNPEEREKWIRPFQRRDDNKPHQYLDPKPKQRKNEGAEASAPVEDAESQFERELTWCIQQLTLGLSNNQQKYTHKQAQTAVDALRTLSSNKAPLIKKRQVMRVNFGDYRKKMADEEKQYYSNLKKPTITSVPAAQQKCIIQRKPAKKSSDTSTEQSAEPTQAPEETSPDDGENQAGDISSQPTSQDAPQTAVNYWVMPTGNAEFKFNFQVSEDGDGHNGVDGSAQQKSPPPASSQPADQPWVMPTGNTDFKFNFDVPR